MAFHIQCREPHRALVSRSPRSLSICLRLGIAAACLLLALAPGRCAEAALPENTTAPAFTLKDGNGAKHSLTEYRGHPIVVLFACGCQWCHEFGLAWAQMQRSGVLTDAVTLTDPAAPPLAPEKAPLTLVVYMGDATQTRLFAQAAGLDLKQSVLLSDPDLKITRQYHAMPCPRLYVLDGNGLLRYVNRHADDVPRKATATVLVSKTIDGLRRTLPPAPTSQSASTPKPASKSGRESKN